MTAPVVHACPEHGHATLCQRSPKGGERVSCWAEDWTCRACLRLVRLLTDVDTAVRRFRHVEEGLALAKAVVPGRAIAALDEDEARRVLLVLRTVLDARAN